MSRSSRHSRLTTRRPSQTHSGLPAGPLSRRAASAISSMLFWPSLAAVGGLFLRLRRLGGAGLGERRRSGETQGRHAERSAQQTQQGDFRHCPAGIDGGRPPTDRSAMRPDWDTIAALFAGRPGDACLKNPHAQPEQPSFTELPRRKTWPERAAFVQRLRAACLKSAAWQRQTRAISRLWGSPIPPGRVLTDAPWSSLPRLVGGGDRRRLGLARRPGADAAVAFGGRRKALLPVLFAVPRRPDPARLQHPDIGRPDRGRFDAARPDHRLRAHLFDRLRAGPDRRRSPPAMASR